MKKVKFLLDVLLKANALYNAAVKDDCNIADGEINLDSITVNETSQHSRKRYFPLHVKFKAVNPDYPYYVTTRAG